jgi:alpha-1,3-rhamnosyl/mannosyltransferase
MSPLHIGVDASCWRNTRGYGRYSRALLGSLVRIDRANTYTLVVDAPECVETLPQRARSRLVRTSIPTAEAASAEGRRSVPDMLRMSRALSGGGFDGVFFPTVYSYVPVFARARKLVFIHDVIAERYPSLTFSNGIARALWNTKVALGRWQADAIVTISEYSRKGLVEHFGLAPERVFVVGAASDPVFRVVPDAVPWPELDAAGVPGAGRLLVYVGGFGPHKNLDALVDAFAPIARRDAFADVTLLFVGEYRREVFFSSYGRLRSRIGELGLADRVAFTGYLSDEAIARVLNRATALVLPSLIEGFGLTAIEAAACGCPVLATTESPLPEILGEGGLFFDPTDTGALESAIAFVLDDTRQRERMREGALAAADRLTWDLAARQMLDVIESVVAR